MHQKRALPIGRKQFEEWSDRIISGALVVGEAGQQKVLVRDQKLMLADLLLHLGPTESHKEDAYFIHSLRKQCVNEVAWAIRSELDAQRKADFAARKAEEQRKAEEAAKVPSKEEVAEMVIGCDGGLSAT